MYQKFATIFDKLDRRFETKMPMEELVEALDFLEKNYQDPLFMAQMNAILGEEQAKAVVDYAYAFVIEPIATKIHPICPNSRNVKPLLSVDTLTIVLEMESLIFIMLHSIYQMILMLH